MAKAVDQVYSRYGRAVHAYLARLTGDSWLADELCQETFARYIQHRLRLKGDNGALGAWLFRVATNLAHDRRRRRRPAPLATEPAAETAPDPVESLDLDARVRREVERLPEELRAAFLLRAHHELAYLQVAEVLGVSERTAKERFRRAREILAHRLAHLVREDPR